MCFLGLNARYYHLSALCIIASSFGKPVKFDVVTEEVGEQILQGCAARLT